MPQTIALLADAISYPLTGIGRYAWVLAKALDENAAALGFTPVFSTAFGLRSFAALSSGVGVPAHDGPSSPPALRRRAIAGLKNWLSQRRWVNELYAWRLDAIHASNLAKSGAQVVHGPNFYLPSTLPGSIHALVTIHDLSVWVDARWHPAARVARMRRSVPGVIQRADRIIVSSDHTRAELSRFFPGAEKRTEVVPLGVDDVFFANAPRPESERRGLLCVSTIEPRKNLTTLLTAYRMLPSRLREVHPLWLVGAPGWHATRERALIAQGVSEGWLDYRGYLPETALIAAYRECRAFIYPSLYEGFGLPILEAFAARAPVICGAHSSLAEVAAGFAYTVSDVTDPKALARTIEDVLEAPYDTARAAAAAAHAYRHRWQNTAQQMLRLYDAG